MKRLFTFLLILLLVLSGCSDQRIYERIGFILNLGIESSKDGELMVTYTSPVIGHGAKPTDVELIISTGRILREARVGARRRSAKFLEAGKIQQILISAELAQKRNVHELIEVLQRDPIDPVQSWIAIVDGSPSEMLKTSLKFREKPRPALYINQLLDDSAKILNTPRTQVYDFDITYYAPGLDPMTPLISFTEKDIKVLGSALFSGGLMVGSIDHSQTFLILMLRGLARRIDYSMVYPQPSGSHGNKGNIVVTLDNNNTKINVIIEDDRPIINISLDLHGDISEYVWDDLSNEEEQRNIEKYIGRLLKRDVEEVLRYTQQVGSDPVGFGDIVRARFNSYWKSIDWNEAYRDAVININVDMDIEHFGTID